MENKFISKILPIFINSGYGVEKFDDTTYDIIDRSIIGKAKIGSIKILDNGDLSVKIGGEAKKHSKFNAIMKNTSFKAKPINNSATVGKIVKNMLSDYKKAKKIIYQESYNELSKVGNDITRVMLERAVDDYIYRLNLNENEINRADLLTYVSDKLLLTEDECEAKFGEILDVCLNYDEAIYNNLMNETFKESELKSDFRKFLKESTKKEDLAREIKEDKVLRRLRETEAYKNSDVEGKYRKLQKYVLGTHGGKFSNTDDVIEICQQIASEDEEIF